MRILILHNRYRQSGGEDVVVDSESNLLRSRGHEVWLFEKNNEDARGLRGAINSVWSRSIRQELKNIINEFKPDIAHIHNVFHAISPAVYGLIASQGIPIVQTLHNFRLFCIRGTFERDGQICERCLGHSLWQGAVLKCYRGSLTASSLLATSLQLHRTLGTFTKSVQQYVVLNEFCRRKFLECGVPEAKLAIKPNFIDIEDCAEERPRSGGLYVGRMAPEKGVQILVAALDRASPSLPFTAIGGGPDEDALRAQKGVNFVGSVAREKVIQQMRQAEYLVMPSIWYETFGLVMIEAFACRLPVIASNIGAMAELVEDGKTGLLFEVGSTEDLAAKLKWASEHPDEMRRMGRAARAKYEQSFTSGENYQQLIAVYERAQADFARQRMGQL